LLIVIREKFILKNKIASDCSLEKNWDCPKSNYFDIISIAILANISKKQRVIKEKEKE